MFSGATNQAARRGLSLVVPLTLAGQASTPGGGARSPAEARQADPHRSEQRLTVLLPPSSTTATPSSCGSRDAEDGGWEEAALGGPTGTGPACSHPHDHDGGSPGSQALIVPRATTDAVTRIIFAGIRGRTAAATGPQQQHVEGGGDEEQEGEDRFAPLERLVAATAADAEVQASVARRVGSDANAALQHLLLRPRAPAAPPALTAYPRPNSSSHSRLPRPLPPSPFSAPAPHHHHHHATLPPRQQSRNFEAAVSCSVCLLPLYEARLLDCGGGHIFCAPCVDQLINPPEPEAGGFLGGVRVPSVARLFSILNIPMATAEDEENAGGWSFFGWLFGSSRRPGRQQQGRGQQRQRVGLGVERRCPECRERFTTAIPVRRINDIVDSVRSLLPDALDAEDLAEQERRAHEASYNSNGAHRSKARRRQQQQGGDEPLPSAAMDVDLPGWVLTLVCLVVVVAMAVGRP